MLKLTKKADYGLISLKHIATLGRDRSASTKEMAEAYGIPAPILSKVLQRLVREGFLISEQGVNGGYRLARDPSRITALEVIRAIDGPVLLTNCFTAESDCEIAGCCNVREPLRKVHERIQQVLDSITIADLSEDDPLQGATKRGRAGILTVIPG
ncbi:MAG: Rrf2 family transcriptional regulator [Bryobacteraceae bacterium]|jgi:Rrf2 family protein